MSAILRMYSNSLKIQVLYFISLFLFSTMIWGAPPNNELSVWANEAIVSTYTFDHDDFINQQKNIAKYFTANGWIAYSKALQESGLSDQIKKNAWSVRAVATLPPEIRLLQANHWEATMPILIVYKNNIQIQKQNSMVKMTFTAETKGVRGFAITSLNVEPINKPCHCDLENLTPS